MESTTNTTWNLWSQNRPTGEQFQVAELDETMQPFGDDLTIEATYEEAKADARDLARKNRGGAFGVIDSFGRVWGIA